MAIIALEAFFKANYIYCARAGQFIKPDDDAFICELIEKSLPDSQLNSRIEFSPGIHGCLLSVCLIIGAWRCARALIKAGADINDPISGFPGNIQPLYFCLREDSDEANDISVLMIEHGADANASSPRSYSCYFDDVNPGARQRWSRLGSMFNWMVHQDNRAAIIAAAKAPGSSQTWSQKVEQEALTLHPLRHQPGQLTAEIEATLFDELKNGASIGAQRSKPKSL